MDLFVSARQREIWNRLQAEDHPYFQQILREAAKDNTTAERYGTRGRWSRLAYQITGDVAWAQRSYATVLKKAGGDFATAPVWAVSNDLREHGAEFVQTYAAIADVLPPADRDAWRGWFLRQADEVIRVGVRLNDSDQVVGTWSFIAHVDRVFGTDYTTRMMRNPNSATAPNPVSAMRDKIRWFCEVLSEGGVWCESSDYNLGTTFLLFTMAEGLGLEQYPDVVAFRQQITELFPHLMTPDLNDMFEFGDEQSPNTITWHAFEDLLAYLGHYSPELRQFEAEVREHYAKPFGAPMYPRYFVWADPFGARTAWRESAGLFKVARGQGQVFARTGWGPDDTAIWGWFPSFSRGEVDHVYKTFGDFRVYERGRWTVDHPIAYSSAPVLANQSLFAGLGASWEVGELTGAHFVPGKLAYMSGTNAGALVNSSYYNPPPTPLHESTPSFFWLIDRGLLVLLERIHLEDPKTQVIGTTTPAVSRYPAADQTKILAAPLLQRVAHSQTIEPVVDAGVIRGDGMVKPLYPATITIVDQANLSLGTIAVKEKKWRAEVVPANVQPFQVLVTIIGPAVDEVDVTVETRPDTHLVRVRKAGKPDVLIISSARPGPKLTTTIVERVSVHDPSKIIGILEARNAPTLPSGDLRSLDVVIEHADRIEYQPAMPTVPIPDPVPVDLWRVTESTATKIVLERT